MINELSITIRLHNANSWRVRKSTGCCAYVIVVGRSCRQKVNGKAGWSATELKRIPQHTGHLLVEWSINTHAKLCA